MFGIGLKRKGGEVKNPDLWIRILLRLEKHSVKFIWVKGHAENEYNCFLSCIDKLSTVDYNNN